MRQNYLRSWDKMRWKGRFWISLEIGSSMLSSLRSPTVLTWSQWMWDFLSLVKLSRWTKETRRVYSTGATSLLKIHRSTLPREPEERSSRWMFSLVTMEIRCLRWITSVIWYPPPTMQRTWSMRKWSQLVGNQCHRTTWLMSKEVLSVTTIWLEVP